MEVFFFLRGFIFVLYLRRNKSEPEPLLFEMREDIGRLTSLVYRVHPFVELTTIELDWLPPFSYVHSLPFWDPTEKLRILPCNFK